MPHKIIGIPKTFGQNTKHNNRLEVKKFSELIFPVALSGPDAVEISSKSANKKPAKNMLISFVTSFTRGLGNVFHTAIK